jgi:hypothetical protein
VTIPESTKEIGGNAFSSCDRLKSVIVPKECEISTRAFDQTTSVLQKEEKIK